MNINDINKALYEGNIDAAGVLPHVEELKDVDHIFQVDFGLKSLPKEPGLLVIRGPRQYGKSTWLEQEIKSTVKSFGPATALYLNGDEIKNAQDLSMHIERLLPLFRQKSSVKRLFIDEITAIDNWEHALKRLLDRRLLKDVLLITTGSKASDLRRGTERLPGRKGKLERNNYLFTPVSYTEFQHVCGKKLKAQTLTAYILTGGCPIACNEITTHGRLPEYVITMIHDWMYGECMAGGRTRSSLLAVLEVLIKSGITPVGHSRLAREAGLANNTVAAGYIELLQDLLTVAPSYAWDPSRKISIKRKPCKFHFINVLSAVVWHSAKIRSIEDFQILPNIEKAKFYEWVVAQELWRRAAIRGDEIPERLNFWKLENHEINFVVTNDKMVEVKMGASYPLDFSWFAKIFPKSRLKVITTTPFETERIHGVPMEMFLKEDCA